MKRAAQEALLRSRGRIGLVAGMNLPPLLPATLLRRYKRFLADVRFPDGAEACAHVANPGAMLGLQEPGSAVWVSRAKPGGKLDWRLHLVEADGALVGVDTSWPNRLAEEAILERRIPHLADFCEVQREVRYGEASRIDLLLRQPAGPPIYVEVKNVHLRRRPGLAEFPDCTAARSAKHMRELATMVRGGARAAVLFVVQREDCDAFAPAADIDPHFAAALREAAAGGVAVLAYACAMGREAVSIARPLAIALAP